MKKTLCLILATLLMLTLCSCGTNSDSQLSLKTISGSDSINFDNPHVKISVYSDESYYFSNRNEDFFEKLICFIENTSFDSKQVEAPKCDDFYISIYDDENHASF